MENIFVLFEFTYYILMLHDLYLNDLRSIFYCWILIYEIIDMIIVENDYEYI